MRAFLKSIDESSMKRLCEITLLTKDEAEILTAIFSKRLDADFVADTYSVSLSTLQRKITRAVLKIRFRLGIRHYYSSEEIHDTIVEALREK